MSLTASISYTSEAKNGSEFLGTITDGTVYGSPLRNTVVTYLYVDKLDQNSVIGTVPTVSSYDPLTATTYNFQIYKDGYYRFKFAIIPIYDAAVNYNLYDVVYYSGLVYRCTAETPSAGILPTNTTYWTAIASGNETSVLDYVGTSGAAANLAYQVYERVIYPFSKVGYGTAAEAAAIAGSSDDSRPEDVKTYEMLAVLIDGMSAADQRSKFTKGEKMARRAQEIIQGNA